MLQKCDGEKSESVKKTGSYDIQSLGELLQFMDNTDSKVYGREIIEAYEENVNRTILLVSHELSLSGAPLVLLHLAESLKSKGFQTIIICGRDGEMFSDNAALKEIPVIFYPELPKSDLIARIRKLFTKIIINTIRCAYAIHQLNATDSSVIWWIHEAGSCYGRRSAKEMPYMVADNIKIYTVGPYSRKMVVSRFPGYKVNNFTYSVPDLLQTSNSSDFQIDLPDKKIFALFGSVIYRKGQDVLISAIKRLPEKVRKGCFFLFVGNNLDPQITSMLKKFQNEHPDNILYMDEIKHNDLCRLYNDIDFLICTSRDDPMPVVIAESMSIGKPCICSEHTASAAIIEKYNSGYVYQHNSFSELAQRIEEAFALNKIKYEEMSKNARRAYEHVFSEQIFEKNLDKFLEEDVK